MRRADAEQPDPLQRCRSGSGIGLSTSRFGVSSTT